MTTLTTVRIPITALIGVYGRDAQWIWQCRLCSNPDETDDTYGWTVSEESAAAAGLLHLKNAHQAT
jgi:hypothetical protein